MIPAMPLLAGRRHACLGRDRAGTGPGPGRYRAGLAG
jgi:hypothetical protein